jgi:hypothetical protein
MTLKRRRRSSWAGISLLEILIAVSILGISFTAIFSGLSAGLRAIARLDQHQRAVDLASNKLNEVLLDPNWVPGEAISGVSSSGLRWRVKSALVDTRPGPASDRPLELVRVVMEVSWGQTARPQTFVLQTLKLRIRPAKANP